MSDYKFPTMLVDLPSRGKLYPEDNPLHKGTVELKYGSANEENILLNDYYINKKIVFDKLIESLLVDKSINQDDMVLGDRNAILIAARIAMYGADYSAKITCPRCGETQTINVDLSKLPRFELPDSVTENRFEFTSSFGNKFVYKLLSVKEDREIDEMLNKQKKLNLSKESQTVTARLIAMVTSINDITEKLKIREYINSMLSKESIELRKDILKNTPDIDTRIEFACATCGYDDSVMLPIDINFFWLTGRE